MARSLGLPTVLGHAAALVRNGWVLGGDFPADRYETATLLASVLGTSSPRLAVPTARAMLSTPLYAVIRHGPGEAPHVLDATDWARKLPSMIDALEDLLKPNNDSALVQLDVNEGGRTSELHITVAGVQGFHRLVYWAPEPMAGMRRVSRITTNEFQPIARFLAEPGGMEDVLARLEERGAELAAEFVGRRLH